MKGMWLAVVGTIIAFVGWWTPWLDLDRSYLKGDLLVRSKSLQDGFVNLPSSAQFSNDPALHVVLLLICHVVFFGLLIYGNANDEPRAYSVAGGVALLIVFFEIFFLVNAAVISFGWNNQFRYAWQYGILVMFVGLALMLSGVFIMWLHIEVDTSFYILDTRLKKVEKELRATQQPEA